MANCLANVAILFDSLYSKHVDKRLNLNLRQIDCLKIKLRQLEVSNLIMEDSNWDSNEFGRRLPYESDSSNDLELRIRFEINLIYF